MATAWAPYKPSQDAPWNVRRVVHLHRRAGFAATWGEVQRDLKDGPKASLDRVLAGPSRRSRWSSSQVAAKPARRCRWTTRRRSQGALSSGS